jgi:hypothetical protein
MLLVPTKKIPMTLWEEWSDIVYDRMGVVSQTLLEHGRDKEANFFNHYRAELKDLWLRTRDRARDEIYRQNYAEIYRRFLRELPATAQTLQDLLDDDWRGGFTDCTHHNENEGDDHKGTKGKKGKGDNGGFRTARGAMIFGYPDYDNPRGIADGWPRPGYLPFVMRSMIIGQVGFLYMGALKPRDGITPGSTPALGYEMVARMDLDRKMMRRVFENATPKAA